MAAQACLTIDGIARRENLAALQYANLEAPAASIFGLIIERAIEAGPSADKFRWLIESATFSLGWMMDPTRNLDQLLDLSKSVDLDHSIRLTALMAIGDMAEKLRNKARLLDQVRRAIREMLETLISSAGTSGFTQSDKPILRSAIYVLANLRCDDDLSLLARLSDHKRYPSEDATPALARWGVDRILLRRAVSEAWQERDPVTEDLGHLAGRASGLRHGPLTLRRLVDPLDSLQWVRDQRASAVERTV